MVRRTNLNCSSLLYDSISYVREMCLQGKYEFQTLRSNQAPAAYYVRSNNWIIVEFHYLDSTCTSIFLAFKKQYIFFKVNSVQEACTKCKFEIMQIT